MMYPRLDVCLRAHLAVIALALVSGLAADARAEPLSVALRGADGPVSLVLASATPEALREVRGLHLGRCERGLCTATADPRSLDVAALREAAVAVTARGQRRPMLEHSLPAAGVTEELRDLGLDGEGVFVIVIDSGLDWRHEAFDDGEGGRRVEWLIDLSRPPTGRHDEVELVLDAAAWDRRDVEAHLEAEREGFAPANPVELRDTFGHGTHVAAVAAGARGVAPAATLIAFRANREDWPVAFEDADVLDAARAGFDLAEAAGRPAVLVLALGGHEGPHDGTSLLERGLADLVGPDRAGRAIVVAAGNSGGARAHARGEARGDAVAVALEIPREDESLAADIELWAPITSTLSLTLRTPSGEALGPVAPGEATSRSLDDAWVAIDDGELGPSPLNGERRATVSLRRTLAQPIAGGRYVLEVSGHGAFDAYLTWGSTERTWGGAWLSTALEPDGTLTVPGTSPDLLVVGATVSRTGWTDESGRRWQDDRMVLGGVAPYSGSGPTRAGGWLPQLVAPGHVVAAAMSADAEAGVPGSVFTPSSPLTPTRSRVVAGGDRAVLWGTSVATPHVAGVVALLLQVAPDLTQPELTSLLVASARVDGGADHRAWNPRWGWGEVDAAAAIRLLREGWTDGAVDGARSAVGAADDVVSPGACTVVTVVPRDADGRPLGPGHQVELEASMGLVGSTSTDEAGATRARWCAGAAPLGSVAVIEAVVDGVRLDAHARIAVARSRSRIGGWADAVGGCQASPRCSRTGWSELMRL